MKDLLRIAIVDPNDTTRDELRTVLLGMETVWLEAECSRYEFFFDVIQQSVPEVVIISLDSDQAKALGYTASSAKVDDKANPTHKPDQLCSNCLQYQGKATDAEAPCTIFGGKLVEAKGWCKVWVKKA